MKGLLIFRVESGNQAFDARLENLLKTEQKKHVAAYHLEDVRVCIASPQDSLSTDSAPVWNMRTNQFGEVLDVRTGLDLAGQLSTFLFGKINSRQDETCAAVFISNGESAASTAAIQAARMFSMRMSSLYPVRVHIIILQDQFVHHDPAADRLMRMLEQSNAVKPIFYASQYMLPWEDSEDTRENSRQTVNALVKAMMMGQSDPMLLKTVGQPMWIETATIRRLEAPVERITNEVFRYLSENFYNQVLVPAAKEDAVATVTPKGAKDCVRSLEQYVNEIERTTLLPTLQDLLCIMPVRNPNISGKLDTDISVDKAWDMIFKIYGTEKGEELRKMLNPSFEEMEDQYNHLGESLTQEMLRQVIQLARASEQEFAAVPLLLQQVGDSLTKLRDKNAGGMLDEDYARGLFMAKDKKEAISMAKARHFYLSTVYNAASHRLSEKRKALRAQVMEDAVAHATQFVKNCLARMATDFKQMCSIYMARPVEKNCFEDNLETAYRYWCSHTDAVQPVLMKELFDFFSEEVFRMSPKDAAGSVCASLENELRQRTAVAVDSIRVHIDSFFSELDFRAELLAKQGVNRNLNTSLTEYLNSQTTYSPLLYQDKAGKPIDIKARALIFHVAEADNFKSLSSMGMVVNDPHEKGVQLVVKYAGNALNDVLVYRNNRSMDGNR